MDGDGGGDGDLESVEPDDVEEDDLDTEESGVQAENLPNVGGDGDRYSAENDDVEEEDLDTEEPDDVEDLDMEEPFIDEDVDEHFHRSDIEDDYYFRHQHQDDPEDYNAMLARFSHLWLSAIVSHKMSISGASHLRDLAFKWIGKILEQRKK
jgi:hypothetical protein